MTTAVVASLVNVSDRMMFGAGATVALAGTYLQWRLTHLCMLTEERIKERKLTEEQARRRIALLNLAGPAAILVGIAICGFVAWT